MRKQTADRFIATGAEQLRAFVAGGGEVLFGTDVGYIPEKDADEEVGRMAGAGMDWRAILVSLTTAPARRLKDAARGALSVGAPADLVLVEGDPRADVQALTHVRATWVAGNPCSLGRCFSHHPTSRQNREKTWGVTTDR